MRVSSVFGINRDTQLYIKQLKQQYLPKSNSQLYSKSLFNFIRNQLSSKVVEHFVLPPVINECPNWFSSSLTLGIGSLFNFSHCNDHERVSYGLICIFLIINDTMRLFVCLLAFCMSSFVCLNLLSIFKLGCLSYY